MWLDTEFSTIEFGDQRLIKRFKEIMNGFMKKAQCSISSTFDTWSSIKGCYRFFSNDKVNSKLIIDAHITSTLSRIEQEERQILIIHDTTYIDLKWLYFSGQILYKDFNAKKYYYDKEKELLFARI